MTTMTDTTPTRPLPARVIYRLPQVLAVTGFTRPWIYKLMARGEFPQSVKIGTRAVGWDSQLVDAWVAAKLGVRA